eukprot:scaffold12455_cov62-Phaeocystis_antarctica.AAC.6
MEFLPNSASQREFYLPRCLPHWPKFRGPSSRSFPVSVLATSLRPAGPSHVHADTMPFALLRSGGLNTGNMLNWGVTVDGVMGGRSSGTASVDTRLPTKRVLGRSARTSGAHRAGVSRLSLIAVYAYVTGDALQVRDVATDARVRLVLA